MILNIIFQNFNFISFYYIILINQHTQIQNQIYSQTQTNKQRKNTAIFNINVCVHIDIYMQHWLVVSVCTQYTNHTNNRQIPQRVATCRRIHIKTNHYAMDHIYNATYNIIYDKNGQRAVRLYALVVVVGYTSASSCVWYAKKAT